MKKFFSIAAAMLFSVSLFATQKIYFKADQGYWNYLDGGVRSATAIYAWEDDTKKNADWPGVRMTKVAGEEYIWEAEIADNFKNVIFVRVNAEGAFTEQGLKTKDLEVPTDGKNLYTLGLAEITDWSNPDLWSKGIQEGEWSVYGSTPVDPEQPSVAVAGAFNSWSPTANVLAPAEDNLTASVKVTLEAQDYQFKMVLSGNNWVCPMAGLYEIKRDHNSVSHINYGGGEQDNFVLKCDAAGEYTFTWTYADSTLAVTFPEGGDVPQVLADGYYLMGIINGAESTWDYAALKAEHLFARNEGSSEAEEYQLKVTLAENDQIQVVSCKEGKVGDWYPGGEGNNYVVDAEHAGAVTIYFRPARNGGDDWWHNCIYVVKEQEGIERIVLTEKATKMVVDGVMYIVRDGKMFNVNGAQVK